MADALTKLRTKLQQDETARRAFADGLKSMISKQGLDPNDPQTLKELGIKDLDVKSSNFVGDVGDSTVIITITQ